MRLRIEYARSMRGKFLAVPVQTSCWLSLDICSPRLPQQARTMSKRKAGEVIAANFYNNNVLTFLEFLQTPYEERSNDSLHSNLYGKSSVGFYYNIATVL